MRIPRKKKKRMTEYAKKLHKVNFRVVRSSIYVIKKGGQCGFSVRSIKN